MHVYNTSQIHPYSKRENTYLRAKPTLNLIPVESKMRQLLKHLVALPYYVTCEHNGAMVEEAQTFPKSGFLAAQATGPE